MGRLSSILFLAALLACPGLAHAQPQPGIAPGVYVIRGKLSGTLTITNDTDGGASFAIATTGLTGNACTLAGQIKGGRATLKGTHGPKACLVTFKQTPDGVQVEDNGLPCIEYCGVNVEYTGLYRIPQPACEPAAVEKTRDAARRLYDQQMYELARATLAPVLEGCAPLLTWSDTGWLRNDLARVQHKLGDTVGCRTTLNAFEFRNLEVNPYLTDMRQRGEFTGENAETAIRLSHAFRDTIDLCWGKQEKGWEYEGDQDDQEEQGEQTEQE